MLHSVLTDPEFADNKLWIVTPTPGDYRLLGPYGERLTPARWSVLTDGLSLANQFRTSINTLRHARDGHWRIRTDDVSGQIEMSRQRARSVATLTQNTLTHPEYSGEVDLWLMAIAHVPELICEPGIIPISDQPSLKQMTHLWFSWREQLLARKIEDRVGPWGDCALTMASVYAQNQATRQVIQYEVTTSDNRAFYPVGFWYKNLPEGSFLGVADNSATVYGVPFCQVGEGWRSLTFDILPRFRQFILSAPNPLVDKDPAHWKIYMATWGTFTNGAARIVSRWRSFNLEYET